MRRLLGPLHLRKRAPHHVALARVGEGLQCFGRGYPACLLDLVVVVLDVPGDVAQQEELDDLRDPPATALVPVAHLAERLDDLRLHARLLAHLAQRGL